MNPRFKSVEARPGYKLFLIFSNGEQGIYDCSHLPELGVFRELRDKPYFSQVRALDGTVVWPHEQDICPDTLYLDSTRHAQPEHQPDRSLASRR